MRGRPIVVLLAPAMNTAVARAGAASGRNPRSGPFMLIGPRAADRL
jgi:hypothetical protein